MIDFANEHPISLVQAANLIPQFRAGRPTSPATMTRWILAGVKVGDRKVHLRAARVGGRWLTSREAIQEFIDAQNTPRDTNQSDPFSKPSRQHASRAQNEKNGI